MKENTTGYTKDIAKRFTMTKPIFAGFDLYRKRNKSKVFFFFIFL